MTTATIEDKARTLGGNAADAYFDEFSEAPDRGTIGDWDASAWEIAWKELKDEGATDADYEECLQAWRIGFFGV